MTLRLTETQRSKIIAILQKKILQRNQFKQFKDEGLDFQIKSVTPYIYSH